jgi:DNA polymerase V
MGIPLFQIREEIKKHRIEVYSSNYTLYGDISSRVHEAIAHFSNEVENYSIDEAFAMLEVNHYSKPLMEMGIDIRSSVKKWTGIPTSIGIAPTKTLAKIAGDIAKKAPSGVFDLTSPVLREKVLAKTDIIDIWGINKRLAKRLQAIGVFSAKDLSNLDPRTARKTWSVVGSRMVEELRGNPSLPLEMITPLKKSVCCSRSFAGEVRTLTEMTESVITYLSTAAEKMRRQRLITNAIQLFVETNLFKEKGLYTNSATIKITPTDSTRELIGHALRILHAIYKPGYSYRKSGVVLLGLQSNKAQTKRLFDEDRYLRDRELMRTLDRLNDKHGRETVRFGMPIKRETAWHMNRNYLSPGYTTDINSILRISI